MARVKTFTWDDNLEDSYMETEMELIRGPGETGLVICEHNGTKYVRHKDRVTPIDDEAKRMLGRE